MLKIIDFIKNNPNWREIISVPPYGIRITDDGDFTILKYVQSDSDFTLEIVRECRGLIINKDYMPVCVPFFKFANYGEQYADKIDWSTAVVQEKIDGSLIKVWNYKNNWHISTNGTIFAEKANIQSERECSGRFRNFAELFKAGAEKAGLDIMKLNPRYTYMFELCSPYNRIVIPYDEIKIYHIGTRNNETLKELETDIGVEKPRTYECSNLSDLIAMADKLKYNEEGYVVKDAAYRRIKVKSPAYVAVHHLINNFSELRMIELMRRNETSEFLTYFPEYKELAETLNAKVKMFETAVTQVLNENITGKTYETRKDFALMANKTPFAAFLFMYYDGKANDPVKWLWERQNDKILDILNKL